MTRIGIIGSDNSHAEIFSKMVNIPDAATGEYLFPDMKVTGIFGLDKDRTEQVARDGRIEYIGADPAEFIGRIDAAVVVFRHGGLHLQYALPFIEAGIPTFVDKPFTIDNEEAKKLIQAAKKNNTLMTGGSTCKYICDIQMVKSEVEKGSRIGKVVSAVMNFPATLENEYGGIYFYGSHLAEMALMAFGYDPVSVVSSQNNGIVTAIVKYDRYQITLNFIPGCTEYYSILYGEKGTILREIDITGCYFKGFEQFVHMLRSKKLPIPMEHLYKPVVLLNAIVESFKTGKEVFIEA